MHLTASGRILAAMVIALAGSIFAPSVLAGQTQPDIACVDLTLTLNDPSEGNVSTALLPAQVLAQCQSASLSQLTLVNPEQTMLFTVEPHAFEVRTFLVQNSQGELASIKIKVVRP